MLTTILLIACTDALDVALPALVLAPDTLALSAVAGSFATAEFTVSNGAQPSEAAAPYSPELLLGESAELPGLTTAGGPYCLHWTAPSCGVVVAAVSTRTTCADGVAEGGPQLALPAGCAATVTAVFAPTVAGELIGAARVSTSFGPWSSVDAPEVWEQSGDPADPVQEVALYGNASAEPAGRLVIDPPLAEMPWRWPDGAATDLAMTLRNIGGAAITVGSPSFSSCSPAWSVVDAPSPGTPIAAGETAAFTLRHTPTEPDAEVCGLVFGEDDDPTSPAGELRFAKPTWGMAPLVSILSPAPGDVLPVDEKVTISFTIDDDDSPPSGVYITIWSAQHGTLGAGVAPDDDAIVEFDVDAGVFQSGADTIRVSLLDWEGFTATDAVAFRVYSPAAEDWDGDSWGYHEGDCDDDNPAAFPGALETGDGVDEDCDGTPDDGAPELDNDRDDFTEAEGDCNDHDDDVSPIATETANNTDDDCDGVVDEMTGRHDDDGDGYSELGNDCDDDDATVNPAAADACDGVDRDCDGVFLACPAATGGFLRATGDVCHPGDTVALAAFTPEGATAWGWTAEDGSISDKTEAVTTLSCPEEPGALLISLTATDADGVQAFDLSTIEVVPADWSLDAVVSLRAR